VCLAADYHLSALISVVCPEFPACVGMCTASSLEDLSPLLDVNDFRRLSTAATSLQIGCPRASCLAPTNSVAKQISTVPALILGAHLLCKMALNGRKRPSKGEAWGAQRALNGRMEEVQRAPIGVVQGAQGPPTEVGWGPRVIYLFYIIGPTQYETQQNIDGCA
jgi:hypothetical protein